MNREFTFKMLNGCYYYGLDLDCGRCIIETLFQFQNACLFSFLLCFEIWFSTDKKRNDNVTNVWLYILENFVWLTCATKRMNEEC